jgi:hypothetical protein
MHIIGSTGEGKSKFIEHLIREDIINGNGLCLIDPHGYLYEDIVEWCQNKQVLEHRKIILFDPLEDNWAFGFNPLKVSVPDVISYHVDAMVKAVAKVWGGEDPDRTPLLKRCLRITFHALAEQKHSLLESQYLVNPVYEKIRKHLTGDIKDPIIKMQWDNFNLLPAKSFYEEFGSTINRMMEFLSSPIIRNTIGQTRDTIDFRKIMDEGHILLVNLSAKDKISEDNARLLGTLIVNDLFMAAKSRPPESRPFYFYIDECARFINEDVARILDEGRKFGLHLILAHQTLAQLRKAGEDIYHSVMTNAKAKVVFGGLNTDDARILTEQVFLGELDLEDSKEVYNKPVVVGHIKDWLHNYSHATGQAETETKGESILESESITYDSAVNMLTSTTTRGSGSASSRAYAESWSWVEGASEVLKPVLEDRPTIAHSLEEQIYRSMAIMVHQVMRHAIIKLPKQKTKLTTTPYIENTYAKDEWIRDFKEKTFELADFIKSRIEVENEIKERWLKIEKKAHKLIEEPKSFRE